MDSKWTFLQGHQIIHPYSVKIPRHKLYIFRRFRIIVRSAHFLRHVRLSPWISAVPTGRIFMKFYIGYVYKNLSKKSDKNIGYFT